MTEMTTGLIEELFASLYVGIVHVSSSRDCQPLHIEIDIFHILG